MRKCKLFICGCVGWLFVIAGYAQTVRYVSPDGTNDITGGYTTWEGAATTIQRAISASSNNDIILVSNGTYTASGAQVVDITKSLDIRGIYGRELTIIDGQNARRCVKMTVNTAGNPIYLSGFTIMNGLTNTGGGVYKEYARDMHIADCVIVSNSATTSHGGGVRATSYLTLSNCMVIDNRTTGPSTFGGGIASSLKLRLTECVIARNEAITFGGGIYVSAGQLDVFASLISSNTSLVHGAGFYLASAGQCVVNQSTVEYNSASSQGGGLWTSAATTNLNISNCLICCNSAGSSGGSDASGAGILSAGGGRIANCLIAKNVATHATSYGGGLSLGSTRIVCENLTIVSNRCGTSGGAGIYVKASPSATVINSIIYRNYSPTAGRSNVYGFVASGITFTNCCTAPLTGLVGEGNTDVDPLFVDLAGDYRLQPSSPCINAGFNQAWLADALDLDGRSRLDRFSGKVDLGCYEYVPKGMLFKAK